MTIAPAPRRWITTLATPDRAAIFRHWMRLDDLSRHRRFGRAIAAEALPLRAEAATSSPSARAIGWVEDGVLRGMAELHHAGGPQAAAEIAISVEARWRGRGIGRRLVSRLLMRARNLGARVAIATTTPDNLALARLARGLGAELSTASGQLDAVFRLAPAGPHTVIADLGAEAADMVFGRLARSSLSLPWPGLAAPMQAESLPQVGRGGPHGLDSREPSL